MLDLPSSLGDRRAVRILDVAAVAWTVVWIVVGWLVYREVRGLASLSDTVVLTGRAIDATARTMQGLSSVPFVGGQAADLAARAHRAATSAIANGRASRSDVQDLAVLLWVAIAAAPTTPLLVLYGLLRERWRRDVCSLRDLAQAAGSDPGFEEFLARRALQHLPYRRLRELSDNPWRDVEDGRTAALAAAELERVGLRRP